MIVMIGERLVGVVLIPLKLPNQIINNQSVINIDNKLSIINT